MKLQNWFDIENGVRLWHNLQDWKENFNSLKDGRYIIIVEKVEDIRSKEQNNSLWGIPYMFFMQSLIECGELENPSKEIVHKWCMANFLPSDYRERIYEEWKEIKGVVNRKTGEVYKDPFRLTTTKMTKIDCMNYYKNMQNGYLEIFSSDPEKDFIPDPKKDWKDAKSDI
jgi:hypothetical protein